MVEKLYLSYHYYVSVPLPVETLSVEVSSSTMVKLLWGHPVDTSAVVSYKVHLFQYVDILMYTVPVFYLYGFFALDCE